MMTAAKLSPSSDAPCIYVACLAAYNNGKLHGAWIDLSEHTTPEEVDAGISTMLKASPEPDAEGYAIHDHENFEGFKVDEHEDLDYLCAAAEVLLTGDGSTIAAVHAHLGLKDTAEGVQEAKAYFEENYAGTARTLEDFAEDFLNETGGLSEMPGDLRPYFDFEKYANDLEMGGDIFTIEGGDGVLVFWNR